VNPLKRRTMQGGKLVLSTGRAGSIIPSVSVVRLAVNRKFKSVLPNGRISRGNSHVFGVDRPWRNVAHNNKKQVL
jgi:hypothetical protein